LYSEILAIAAHVPPDETHEKKEIMVSSDGSLVYRQNATHQIKFKCADPPKSSKKRRGEIANKRKKEKEQIHT